MKRQTLIAILAFSLVLILAGCFRIGAPRNAELLTYNELPGVNFQKSGTIILSRAVPQFKVSQQLVSAAGESIFETPIGPMAPLLGYIPPSVGFLPASNETWLELDSTSKMITVYRGKAIVSSIQAEGTVGLNEGLYALQSKETDPLWYAPDDYFAKRKLDIPEKYDRQRYRRGALGELALYPSNAFAIHSAAVWNDDVGGLRVSQADLAKIYYLLPAGASIVVK